MADVADPETASALNFYALLGAAAAKSTTSSALKTASARLSRPPFVASINRPASIVRFNKVQQSGTQHGGILPASRRALLRRIYLTRSSSPAPLPPPPPPLLRDASSLLLRAIFFLRRNRDAIAPGEFTQLAEFTASMTGGEGGGEGASGKSRRNEIRGKIETR